MQIAGAGGLWIFINNFYYKEIMDYLFTYTYMTTYIVIIVNSYYVMYIVNVI